MKRIIAFFLCLTIILSLFGCTGKRTFDFSVEDVSLTLDEITLNDEEVLAFSYKNNTNYTILRIAVTYVLKSDATEEQRTAFSKCAKDGVDVTDMSVSAYNLNSVASGGASDVTPCDFINFSADCEFEGYSDVLTPDFLTVTFVDDDRAYGIYYNFERDKYDEYEELNRDRYEWSSANAASYVNRPEECVSTEILYEDEKKFSFSACGVTKDGFDKYLQSLKDSGFTFELKEESDTAVKYSGANKKGVRLSIEYKYRNFYASPEYIICSVSIP